MRPARKYEVPRLGSVWTWREGGSPIVVVGLRLEQPRVPDEGRSHIVMGVRTDSGTWYEGIWTQRARVLVGPVLVGWFCIDEGPDA